MELDDITGAIVDAAVQIHRTLGPGLLEPLPPSSQPSALSEVFPRLSLVLRASAWNPRRAEQ